MLVFILPAYTFAISGRIYFYNNIQFYGDEYNTIVNNNCNFNSQPYSTVTANSDQCGRICSLDSQCSHFTYEIGGYCALRRGPVGLDKPIASIDIRKCGIYGDYSRSGCSFNTGSVQCQGDPNPNGSPNPIPKPQNTPAPNNGNLGSTNSGSNGATNSNAGNSPLQSPVPTLTIFVHITTTIAQGNSLPTGSIGASGNSSHTSAGSAPGPTSSNSTPVDPNSGDLTFTSRILIIVGVALAVIVVLLIPFVILLNKLMNRKQEMINEAKEARKEAAVASNRAIEQRYRTRGHRLGKVRSPPGNMGVSQETVLNSKSNDP
ncbi:hypothetical protein HK103_001494 [Boothiomyces macroporosus]|uniref:Apple domain-containing protein n=1 Tax=Boothiomyces macroporosus TaxID=261099 RepID=A0AAD5UJK1_9FUNG|nr:hypothetical protein HK103_001494 [Boothiomyces macroporosus]